MPSRCMFFDVLPNYMKIELERVQNRAFSVICPNKLYIQALQEANIPTIVVVNTCFIKHLIPTLMIAKKQLLPTLNNISYNLPTNINVLKFQNGKLIVVGTLSSWQIVFKIIILRRCKYTQFYLKFDNCRYNLIQT